MNSRHFRLSLTAAGMIAAFAASAHADAPAAPASGSARVGLLTRTAEATSPLNALGETISMLAYNVSHVNSTPRVELNGVHYRPRRGYRDRDHDHDYRDRRESSSASQIHLGFFNPEGPRGEQFLVGLRGGPMIDSRVQLGLAVDWIHKNEKTSSITSSQEGPGGTQIEVRQDLARSSSHLFPLMAYIQFSVDDNLPVVPYFGAGAGYEVLLLSAEDFTTGAQYDGTFGGWGWQAWGGVALPLSGRTRLSGEVFINRGDLARNSDVKDGFAGSSYRETINVDGAGARFGLAWGF